jgi:hypothetical protein
MQGEKQEWIEKFSQKSSKGWTNLPILEDIVLKCSGLVVGVRNSDRQT